MRIQRTHIFRRMSGAVAALLLVVALFSSCASDELALADSTSATDDTTTVQIQFTLNIMGSEGTRAETWGDLDEETSANDFENYIDDIHVLVYPGTDATATVSSPELEDITYSGNTVTGRLKIDESQLTDGKFVGWIVVLANYDQYKNKTGDNFSNISSFADNRNNLLEYLNGYGKDAVKKIPMWGFKKYTTDDNSAISLQKGIRANMGDIPMLRSLAKIKVSLDAGDVEKGYLLTRVKLTNYMTAPYIAPTFWDAETNNYNQYSSVSDIPTDKTIHWYDGEDNKKGESFFLQHDKDGDYYYTYLCEMPSSFPSKITLTYEKDGVSKDAEFVVGDYSGNSSGPDDVTKIDIIRNTVYDYTVKIAPLNVSLAVLPWNVTESSIGWNVEDDDIAMYAWEIKQKQQQFVTTTNSEGSTSTETVTCYNYNPNADDATEGDSEAVYCYVSYPCYASGTSNKYVKDSRSGADFYLLIAAPEGAVWQAHLTDDTNFELETADGNGKTWECKDRIESSGSLSDGTEYKYNINTSKHRSVSTGIARDNLECEANTVKSGDKVLSTPVIFYRPYRITVKPKNKWYDFSDDATKETGEEYYQYNSSTMPNTDNGDKWETEAPYTDLYITVSLNGVDEYKLPINPVVENWSDSDVATKSGNGKTFYSDKRRFAIGNGLDDKDTACGITDTNCYIRIWQLKATNKSDAEMAADNSNKTNTTYYGWTAPTTDDSTDGEGSSESK